MSTITHKYVFRNILEQTPHIIAIVENFSLDFNGSDFLK